MKNCIFIQYYLVGCAIAITFSTYYIICLYRDYLNSLPYWNKLRNDKIIAKESYEFIV